MCRLDFLHLNEERRLENSVLLCVYEKFIEDRNIQKNIGDIYTRNGKKKLSNVQVFSVSIYPYSEKKVASLHLCNREEKIVKLSGLIPRLTIMTTVLGKNGEAE